MIDRIRRALGIKSDADIRKEVNGEPSVRKALKALGRAEKWTGIGVDILEDYQAEEDARLGIEK